MTKKRITRSSSKLPGSNNQAKSKSSTQKLRLDYVHVPILSLKDKATFHQTPGLDSDTKKPVSRKRRLSLELIIPESSPSNYSSSEEDVSDKSKEEEDEDSDSTHNHKQQRDLRTRTPRILRSSFKMRLRESRGRCFW